MNTCPERSEQPDAKELLKSVLGCKSRLCDAEYRMERISEELESAESSAAGSGMTGAAAELRWQRLDSERRKLEKKYAEAFENYSAALNRAYDLIDAVEDDLQRQVITLIYVENKTVPEVSYELSISNSWVKRLHYKALDAINARL